MAKGPGGFILALVVLAAGFGGGYLVGSREQPRSAEPVPLVADGDARSGSSRPDFMESEGGPELEATGDPSGLRTALAQLPAPEVPAGDGVIAGRVTTEAGAPIPGVEVKATPKQPESLRTYVPRGEQPLALDEVVRRTVAAHRWRALAARRTTTGADGTFRLEGIADLEHDVRPSHPDYQTRNRPPEARRARPGAELAFTMRPQVPVTVELVLPDGSAPEQGDVRFGRSRGGTRHFTWTPANPVVRPDPGMYTVTATSGEDAALGSEPQTVTVEEGMPMTLRFELRGNPSIRGRLIHPPGETWRNCHVAIARLAPGVRADASLLQNDDDPRSRMRMGRREGTFSFPDLRPGRYLIGAARTHRGSIVVMKEIEVGAALVETEIEMPPLGRDEYVAVHVLGPDAKTLRDVRISTGYVREGSSSSGGGDHLVRPDGTLWVLHHVSGVGEAAGGRHWIEVRPEGHGALRQDYDRAKDRELTFRFEKPATLTVDVKGVEGTRYEGRVALAIEPDEGSGPPDPRRSGRQPATVDPSGHAKVADLQPGRYWILLTLGERRFGGFVIASTARTLTSGANTVSLALPALYVVTFEGVSGHLWVGRNEAQGMRGNRTAQATAEGRVVMDGLPAGGYFAQSGSTRKEFTLPGTSTLDLR